MKTARVSTHLVAVWSLFVTQPQQRWENRGLAQQLGMAESTARHHTKTLTDAGLVVGWSLFPCNLYRLAPDAETRQPEFYGQLEACRVLLGEAVPRSTTKGMADE